MQRGLVGSEMCIRDRYQRRVHGTVSKHGDKEWYRTKSGDYVIPVTGTGLWGKIDAVIGFDKTFKTLTGISFTANNETPGLGARITEKWFCKQFRDKKAPLSFVAEGTKTNKNNEFDAITGATITTSAVRDMVNKTAKEAPGMVWSGKQHGAGKNKRHYAGRHFQKQSDSDPGAGNMFHAGGYQCIEEYGGDGSGDDICLRVLQLFRIAVAQTDTFANKNDDGNTYCRHRGHSSRHSAQGASSGCVKATRPLCRINHHQLYSNVTLRGFCAKQPSGGVAH
eukprot:TRINITY_DN8832_c0_g1_i2.p2 TRINITY_DN8832_c0_g1~~TRINITY_DN8832_c0_g1_i2.p2  ORF type:complete len:280 (-),score=51.00 TRINITY_DN8832_c0_g1_i2:4-843(-)